MPTVFAHALVPIAIGLGLGSRRIPPRLLMAGAAAAMLPDADVVAFKFGIAYADALGHRGASHSVVFALLLGVLAALCRSPLRARAWTAFLFVACSGLSHPLLDMLTNGGLGVALLWPWSEQRFFAPWQVIEVSPFAHRFFSARGVEVLWSEARWIGMPALLLMATLAAPRFLWERHQSR
ncbi:metal-dependent hydrolase [Pseudoxanthomonas sp. z9]|uniref:metal-dependent hydrolase n=1 Tax=Pseudoxanthomonas sp. z9 TaxID=2584942 RepID=UPI0011442121|nr:metal-dependent hydrolase [Pseudoxanthomonas sp. z9]